MSIDITEQIAAIRREIMRGDCDIEARQFAKQPYQSLAKHVDILRAVLATLERVAAEEQPGRMQ